MIARASISAIEAYQRHLSPRKGYACAYRVLNGGTGCSGFAKYAILEHGLWRATPKVFSRFAACKAAAAQLNTQHDHEDGTTGRKTRWYDHCNPCTGGCYCPGGSSKSGNGGCDGTPDCSPDCCSL